LLYDGRYDNIIHLETAAKGAEEYFTLDNNVVRDEGLDLARSLCTKVRNV
jgi:hypothetical protein